LLGGVPYLPQEIFLEQASPPAIDYGWCNITATRCSKVNLLLAPSPQFIYRKHTPLSRIRYLSQSFPKVNRILPEVTETLYPFEACLLNLADGLEGKSIVRIKKPLGDRENAPWPQYSV
jgi:hypothetical protein